MLAIVSTTENQEYIRNLAQKYGVSTDKVCTFDDFIERVQKAHQNIPQSQKRSMREALAQKKDSQMPRRQVVLEG